MKISPWFCRPRRLYFAYMVEPTLLFPIPIDTNYPSHFQDQCHQSRISQGSSLPRKRKQKGCSIDLWSTTLKLNSACLSVPYPGTIDIYLDELEGWFGRLGTLGKEALLLVKFGHSRRRILLNLIEETQTTNVLIPLQVDA